MADTGNPIPDTQQQQQEEEQVTGDGDKGETTAEAPKNEETQETQEGQDGGGDNAADDDVTKTTADGDDGGAGEGDAAVAETTPGEVTGADGQQEAGSERQPTPAVAPQEDTGAQENKPDAEEPQAPTESESAPEPEAESKQEPTEEPKDEPEERKKTPAPEMKMSEEQMKRCQHYFDRRAVEGRLDLKGFKLMFRLMGEVLSAQDADSMFQGGNRDDKDTIDFQEFCRLYCCHSQEEHSRKAAMMDSIDKLFPGTDGSPVELKKVKSLLLKMQRPDLDMRLVREKSDLNAGDIHRLVNTMDTSGTGLVSKQEFVDTLCKHLDHI